MELPFSVLSESRDEVDVGGSCYISGGAGPS